MLCYPFPTRSEGPLLRVNQASRSRSWHLHRRRRRYAQRADAQSRLRHGDEPRPEGPGRQEPGRDDSGRREHGAGGHVGMGRRALRRRLARAIARIEQSHEYQRSLGNLAQLAAAFQRELDVAQRGRWLSLEEAMHEHAAWLSRAYFYAGVACAKHHGPARAASAQREPARGGAVQARAARSDAELIAELAELLLELLERRASGAD